MSLSRVKRFEILKRDAFTCRYCGKCCLDAALEVDHVEPRAVGGPDADWNLVTACVECNRGKRDNPLPEELKPLVFTPAQLVIERTKGLVDALQMYYGGELPLDVQHLAKDFILLLLNLEDKKPN